MCARQIGGYSVEISWSDEADHGPDATKAVWEVEVVESASDVGGGSKVHILHVAPHAPDALRIAKGLVRFYHALTQRSRAANDAEVVAITLQTAEQDLRLVLIRSRDHAANRQRRGWYL